MSWRLSARSRKVPAVKAESLLTTTMATDLDHMMVGNRARVVKEAKVARVASTASRATLDLLLLDFLRNLRGFALVPRMGNQFAGHPTCRTGVSRLNTDSVVPRVYTFA